MFIFLYFYWGFEGEGHHIVVWDVASSVSSDNCSRTSSAAIKNTIA